MDRIEWTDSMKRLVEKHLDNNLTLEEQKEFDVLIKVPQFKWYVENVRRNRTVNEETNPDEILATTSWSKWVWRAFAIVATIALIYLIGLRMV